MVHAKTKNANQVGLGRALINKKVKEARQSRESQRHTTELESNSRLNSVTQEKDLDEFLNTAQLASTDFTAEKQNVRIIHTPTAYSRATQSPFLLSSEDEKEALRRHWELRSKLRVPRRPVWTKEMTPAQLEKQEREAFLEWRRNLAELEEKQNLLFTPFERNIEVWKQLWRVLERSHLVVQIVDARNPLRFRCQDLETYVEEIDSGETSGGKKRRKSLLLINKSDLLTIEQRKRWADYFDAQGVQYAFFSAANAKALQEARRETEAPESEDESRHAERLEGKGDAVNDTLAQKVGDVAISSDQAEEDPDISQELENSEEGHVHNFDSSDHSTSDEDSRTRVLSVLELESLFVNSAPDLSDFADAEGKLPPKLVVGLVGYPNVGKSSTINSLLGEKKVSVSSTPGKTKHFQTIHLSPSIVLCDCPGLVFPQFATTKAELVCDGVLPIDQMREHTGPVSLVTQRIPREILEGTYGLTIRRRTEEEGGGDEVSAEDLLIAYAVARGFARSGVGNPDESRAARYILKDYVNAKLLYCQAPPDVDPDEFNGPARVQIVQRLIESGKKMAPITRVRKNADTFIAPEPSAGGATLPPTSPTSPTRTSLVTSPSSPPAPQSGRSRALDESFFDKETSLAARPFVQGSARNGVGISRTKLYPHQNIVANDGTVVSGQQAHAAAVLTSVGGDVRPGKKHHKAPRAKLRSGTAATGYD